MKNKNIHIRVDEETHETIKLKALESYLTISEYVVQCSLGKQIFVIPGLDEMVLEQKRIGNNLNQLAHLANADKISVVGLDEMIAEHHKLTRTLNDLLERRRWR